MDIYPAIFKAFLSLVATYPSGSHLTTMPTTLGHSFVLPHRLFDLGQQVIDRSKSLSKKVSRSFDIKQKTLFSNLRSVPTKMDPVVPVLGLWTNDSGPQNSAGRVAVFGDSMCLDSSGGSKSGKHVIFAYMYLFINIIFESTIFINNFRIIFKMKR